MMRMLLTRIFILFLWMGAAATWAGDRQAGTAAPTPTPEDMKVIAVMEILQLLEVTEKMEMIKDLDYLIEDDQDEPKKD